MPEPIGLDGNWFGELRLGVQMVGCHIADCASQV